MTKLRAACALVFLTLAGLATGWLISGPVAPPEAGEPGPDHAAELPSVDALAQATTAEAPSVPASRRPEASIDLRSLLGGSQRSSRSQPAFREVTEELKVHFVYFRGETGEYWLPEAQGGGVAWLDYDGDGRLDLFFTQGCQLPVDRSGTHVDVLYRNVEGRPWQRVPQWAAPSDPGYGMGVAVGDFDNDGFPDVFVGNYGVDSLYVNNGDGTFSLRTGVGIGSPGWTSSAATADLDRDGDLDLYAATYIQFVPYIQCATPTGRGKYCGPDYYDGEQDLLLVNDGRGIFWNMVEPAGVVVPKKGKGLGVVIADLIGNDGWPEIFVANDLQPNFLFVNLTGKREPVTGSDGPWRALRFEEKAFELGAAVNAEGVREANMGIACGDFDNDLDLDLYVTHYFMEHDTLWRNESNDYFLDVTKPVGLSVPTLQQLSWGTQFIDYDNDGWLDIFITSGHINDDGVPVIPYAMRPQLMHNLGGTTVRFVEVSNQAGPYFQRSYVGRSSAAGDFDRDGRVDLAVLHHHVPASVLRNETDASYHFLGLQLVGIQSPRSGIGARVLVELDNPTGPNTLLREIVGGGSYLSNDATELLIGLGSAQRIVRLSIRWPSGREQSFTDVPLDRWLRIYEGRPELHELLPGSRPTAAE